MRLKSAIFIVVSVALAAAGPKAQTPGLFTDRLLESFTYRTTGPARMGARVSAIAVPDAPTREHLYTFYVAFWAGGLFKTTNNGTTFDPIFDGQSTLSIGAVAIAHSNSDLVWVGTGDAFTSRTSYAGDGVYKSLDGGKTWKNMGLKDSQHIARIVIDPNDPNIVYVAAMGTLYSDNAERGVFKTTNGGESWEKILYVNERVGIIDLVMNPKNPAMFYAAAYEKQRLPWQMVNGGPGTAIYKTTDSGRNWTKLAGGLPTGKIGRIGLAIYPSNPDILYAVIENENPRDTSGAAAAAPGGGRGGLGATYGGQVYRTDNGGQAWTKMSADDYNVSPKGPYYFSQIFVDPGNDQNIFVTQDGFRHSIDGGRNWNAPQVFPRMFGDTRTLWIDPENPKRMIQGSDGGIAISYDGGRTSDAYANIPIGSIYAIGVDMEDPYNIYAGLQDHENWRGPSNTSSGRAWEADWIAVGDGDGIVTVPDPKDSRWLYTTREYGGHSRLDQKLGYETNIVPVRQQGDPYRWLWEPPLVISPHNTSTIYAGAQVLLKSTDRGDHWTEISPDLSTNDTSKIMRESEGSVPGGIPWFAICSIAESPVTAGVIWAGTSDGKVQVTRNGGTTWADLTAKITAVGGRQDAYVSRVRASPHAAGRAYVSKSGYKYDDFRPYLFVTEDFGATWKSIAGNLPDQPINVVYDDAKNPNLLFVGNDTGVFVSINRGASWTKMNNNMPNVPVRDLLVHPRENDLILGTYGHNFWITNIAPLQELSESVLAEDVHLFTINPTVQRVTWSFGANDYLFGQRYFPTANEQNAMAIRYYLKSPATGSATVVIADAKGQEVARLTGRTTAGVNTVFWTMRSGGAGRGGGGAAARAGGAGGAGAVAGAGAGVGAGAGAGRGGSGAGSSVLDQLMPLGDYTITLEVSGKTLTQKGRIAATQGWSLGPAPQIIR